jgi:hypothetical protein
MSDTEHDAKASAQQQQKKKKKKGTTMDLGSFQALVTTTAPSTVARSGAAHRASHAGMSHACFGTDTVDKASLPTAPRKELSTIDVYEISDLKLVSTVSSCTTSLA